MPTRRMNSLRSPIHAIFFLLALCGIALSAHAAKVLHNIELDWRPTSKIVAGSGNISMSGLTVQLGQFGDARDNKNLIGENREEADEGTVLPVSTVTDVPAWAAKHLKDVLLQNGVNIVDSGAAIVLDGDVRRFFVEETGTYQANIVLHLRARDASGAVLWESNLSANTSRFGRSYKKENYCETLSDTLIGLAHALLGNVPLRDALAAGAQPAAGLAPVAQDPVTEETQNADNP